MLAFTVHWTRLTHFSTQSAILLESVRVCVVYCVLCIVCPSVKHEYDNKAVDVVEFVSANFKHWTDFEQDDVNHFYRVWIILYIQYPLTESESEQQVVSNRPSGFRSSIFWQFMTIKFLPYDRTMCSILLIVKLRFHILSHSKIYHIG